MLVEWLEVSMIDLLLSNDEIPKFFFLGFVEGFVISAFVAGIRAVVHAFKVIVSGGE